MALKTDKLDNWLDRYNTARNRRNVFARGELVAAEDEGCDPAQVAARNDELCEEYDTAE